MKNLILTLILFATAQSLVWIQTNGQFINEWFRKYPLIVSCMGIPISYLYIKATSQAYKHFNELWPGRMLAFSVGIVVFAALTWFLMGETVNFKTGISLALAFLIILIQLFL
jgi:hypothetical protein